MSLSKAFVARNNLIFVLELTFFKKSVLEQTLSIPNVNFGEKIGEVLLK